MTTIWDGVHWPNCRKLFLARTHEALSPLQSVNALLLLVSLGFCMPFTSPGGEKSDESPNESEKCPRHFTNFEDNPGLTSIGCDLTRPRHRHRHIKTNTGDLTLIFAHLHIYILRWSYFYSFHCLPLTIARKFLFQENSVQNKIYLYIPYKVDEIERYSIALTRALSSCMPAKDTTSCIQKVHKDFDIKTIVDCMRLEESRREDTTQFPRNIPLRSSVLAHEVSRCAFVSALVLSLNRRHVGDTLSLDCIDFRMSADAPTIHWIRLSNCLSVSSLMHESIRC
jgi:hypothetical protein